MSLQPQRPLPVFYDARGRRWKVIRRLALLALLAGGTLLLALAVAVFAYTGPTSPAIPGLDDAARRQGVGWTATPVAASPGRPAAGKVVLTFDDGPDPTYTPAILEILRKERVNATFFVVGMSALRHPDLVRRIEQADDEVGHHTFTHANVARLHGWRLQWELNASQLLLQSILGKRVTLFRPPFSDPSVNRSPEELAVLSEIGRQGYYIVGMNVIPRDWELHDPQRIVDLVVSRVVPGAANVVLLHDGGGNRRATVEALPPLIEELRARGFELTTVGGLLHVDRGALMPPVLHAQAAGSLVSRLAFAVLRWWLFGFGALFGLAIVLGVLRTVLITTLAVIRGRKARWSAGGRSVCMTAGGDGRTGEAGRPLVSVIVPAFNEEKVICGTVRSLLRSTWRELEIVVVDDGSTDRTFERAKDEFSADPRVRVWTKANGGKSDALNHGIERCNGEIVVTMDADTQFRPETIETLVGPFSDPRVGAVAGNVKVGNRTNSLTRCQAFEYMTSQNLERRSYDLMNCIPVVPGAVGAWRREAVAAAGGFSHQTLAEDADLTFTLIRSRWRVVFEEDALGFTEAPERSVSFLRQRVRWIFGMVQTAWKHRGLFPSPRHGSLGLFAIPNIFVFQLLFPLLAPVADLLVLLSAGWALAQGPQQMSDGFSAMAGLQNVFLLYAALVAVEMVLSLIPFFFERSEDRRLLVWAFLQRFFYRQLISAAAYRSLYLLLKGARVGWNKLERTATVTLESPSTAAPAGWLRPGAEPIEAGDCEQLVDT